MREESRPFLVHAKVPLLNHHTSGVRMEWYRDDLEEANSRDPYPVLKQQLIRCWIYTMKSRCMRKFGYSKVKADFEKAQLAEDPRPEDLFTHDFAPTPITEEEGEQKSGT